MNAPNDPAFRARLIRALAASVATGVVMLIGMRAALPAIARTLTTEQVGWLRRAFADHPWVVLASITLIAAIFALPVLIAFRLAFGPVKGQWRRSWR